MEKEPGAGSSVGRALGRLLDAVVLDLEYVRAHAFPARRIAASPEQRGLCQDFLLQAMVWLLDHDPSLHVVVDGLPGGDRHHESMRRLADHLGQRLRIVAVAPAGNRPYAGATAGSDERITVGPGLTAQESAELVFNQLALAGSVPGRGPVPC